MKWNNGAEQIKFKREQKRLRKRYKEAGMTEEAIETMYQFDCEWYKSRRREALHTQKMNIETFDEEGDVEGKNPLYKKFLQNFCVRDKYWETGAHDWIEDIENENLYEELKNLSEEDKEVLREYVFMGLKQKEISEGLGISQQAISKKIKKFREIFRTWL